ncbi:MAG TPA: hypothetical protein VIK06_06185 [Candidatus Limnocylindrales bacterium]
MSFRLRALTVVVYAAAMAYVESAAVVYLQRAQGISPEHLFPLQSPQVLGNLAGIEVGREAATLFMLATVGVLAGRRWLDRLAWCAVAFGVWDIGYYFWLWVFIGWPHSPATWDVLFLIPVPWAGPVVAPITVSLALIGFGLGAAWQVGQGRALRVSLPGAVLALAGGFLVILSFTLDVPDGLGNVPPPWHPWPIFVVGMALAAWAGAMTLRVGVANVGIANKAEKAS